MTRLGDLFGDVLGKLRQQQEQEVGLPKPEDKKQQQGSPTGRDVSAVGKISLGTGGHGNGHVRGERPTQPPQQLQSNTVPPLPLDPEVEAAVTAGPVNPEVESADQRWADAERLVIKAARATSRGSSVDAVDPASGGETAVVGLDFGTAFTKAVVRFRGTDYAVDWKDAVELDGEDQYLLPTCFSECSDGRILLGSRVGAGWKVHYGIKMALLQPDVGQVSAEAVESAVLFVAAAFRHVQWWARRNVPMAIGAEIGWRLHLGVPSTGSGQLQDTFLDLGRRAWLLAHSRSLLSRERAAQMRSNGVQGVTVVPELSAQMNAYHFSHQRQSDLHALMDFGAGTLDCVFFLSHHNEDDGDVIGVLDSRVEPLGIHRLLAALVGKRGEEWEWEDSDSSLDDAGVRATTGEELQKISNRRTDYGNKVAKVFYNVWNKSRQLYGTGPVNRHEQRLPVFFVGGGSRNGWIEERINRLLKRDFVQENRISEYWLTPLPAPQTDRFSYSGNAYHRMAVAHGLCEMKLNLGEYRPAPNGDASGARRRSPGAAMKIAS